MPPVLYCWVEEVVECCELRLVSSGLVVDYSDASARRVAVSSGGIHAVHTVDILFDIDGQVVSESHGALYTVFGIYEVKWCELLFFFKHSHKDMFDEIAHHPCLTYQRCGVTFASPVELLVDAFGDKTVESAFRFYYAVEHIIGYLYRLGIPAPSCIYLFGDSMDYCAVGGRVHIVREFIVGIQSSKLLKIESEWAADVVVD